MYKILLSLSFLLLITGCATYKVVPQSPLVASTSNYETITVEKIKTQYPEGGNCFEPMLTFATLEKLGTLPLFQNSFPCEARRRSTASSS